MTEETPFVLKWKYSRLFEKTNYTTNYNCIVNTIREYDIKDAGFSIIKRFKLLNKKSIKMLDSLDKHTRKIKIGILRRDDSELSKAMTKCMKKVRQEFFLKNTIQDNEVVSIKNDAIFVSGRRCRHLIFDGVEFVVKNEYTSYHKISGFEFYYNQQQEKLDIKGISDDIVNMHSEYILKFMMTCFDYIERGQMDKLKKIIVKTNRDYKSRKLPVGYYRQFDSENEYRYMDEIDGEAILQLTGASEETKDRLDIAFNYNFLIRPMCQLYLF